MWKCVYTVKCSIKMYVALRYEGVNKIWEFLQNIRMGVQDECLYN